MKNKNGHRIGINTLFMIPNAVGGTEYHLRSFLSSLEKQDRQNEYIVFCNNENYDTFQFTNPLWKKVRCPIWATSRLTRIFFEQCILPFLVMQEKCTILHSYGYFGPMLCPTKHIITVHDANWQDCPEDISFIQRIILTFFIEQNIKTAHIIITDSEFSKKRLIHYFSSIKQKLQVVSPWVSEIFLNESKTKHGHPLGGKPYILCVSGMYPHKRIPYVLDLWEKIMEKDAMLHLVLIGKNGNDEREVVERIKYLPRISYYPKVTLSTLVKFYEHAKAFIFPSVYEGFGYPVYEAVSVGKTVFVGKKELYSKVIQENVHEISFDASKDARLIITKINDTNIHKKMEVHENFRGESVQMLLSLYKYLLKH